MTRLHHTVRIRRECETCCGDGEIAYADRENDVTCPECEGDGELEVDVDTSDLDEATLLYQSHDVAVDCIALLVAVEGPAEARQACLLTALECVSRRRFQLTQPRDAFKALTRAMWWRDQARALTPMLRRAQPMISQAAE